ncbi:MAG TPA: hypothetical protein VHT71_10930 [Methylomirabilota bacterium]|jgi:hypothetical protein|nr:hypothetical protein [Methylomirabilota bacterium]
MRPASIAWERSAEVRVAAEGWRRSGAITEATHRAIIQAYPDPCVTPSVVWRVLTAVMVSAIAVCTFGAFWIAIRPDATGSSVLLWLCAAGCFLVTEALEASSRHARRGAAGTASFWGSLFALVGLAVICADSYLGVDRAIHAVLLASIVIWGVGAWRWGNPLFAGISASSVFLLLGRAPLGRLWWIVAGVAVTALAARAPDDGTLPPSHRRSAMVLTAIGIAATYVAVNVYSLEERVLESLRGFGPAQTEVPAVFLGLGVLGTALLPLAVLAWAIRSRRTYLLDLGVVLLALSLVTLRHYVHVAPLWVVLIAAGALLIGVALAVERALRARPGGELAGFTADALFSDERRQRLLQAVPIVATFTPASAPPVTPEGFAGQGGRFGGGGASDRF